MIDTIVLTLPQSSFRVTDHNRFSPSTVGLYSPPYYTLGGRGSMPCVQNPTASELKAGIYKPRLTVTKRLGVGGFDVTMKIELSLPKLVYGNNFDELSDTDLTEVVEKLRYALQSMAVEVGFETLLHASVSAVHYSKNIPLTDYSTPSAITRLLEKVNLNQRLDLNSTKFRNDGYALHYHANSYQIVFYDKIKDLQQAKVSEKRAIETDNSLQLSLFDNLPSRPFEVLRVEIRLNTRKKIRQVVDGLIGEVEPTLNNLFSSVLSQKVVVHYWETIVQEMSVLSIDAKKPLDMLIRIKQANPQLRARSVLSLYAAIVLSQQIGNRALRLVLGFGSGNSHSWYKLRKEMAEISLKLNETYQPLTLVEQVLKEYKPLRLADYQ